MFFNKNIHCKYLKLKCNQREVKLLYLGKNYNHWLPATLSWTSATEMPQLLVSESAVEIVFKWIIQSVDSTEYSKGRLISIKMDRKAWLPKNATKKIASDCPGRKCRNRYVDFDH